MEGTPARIETLRRRAQGDGALNTASIEWLNATLRERLATLTRRSRALPADAAAWDGAEWYSVEFVPLMQVFVLLAQPRPPWPLGLRIMAGVCQTSCRITCAISLDAPVA